MHSKAVDEVLYGRAGFLSSLLFVKKHVGAELSGVSELVPAMRKVFDLIIESGKRSSGVKSPNTGLDIAICISIYKEIACSGVQSRLT